MTGNSARIAWFSAALVILSGAVAVGCDLCSGKLPRRTGPFTLHLSVVRSTVRVGEPIFVDITLTNQSSRVLRVDPSSTVEEISRHIDAPAYRAIDPDKVAKPNGRFVPPGATITFARRALQDWGAYGFTVPGWYIMNVSYANVDSNPIEFFVVR